MDLPAQLTLVAFATAMVTGVLGAGGAILFTPVAVVILPALGGTAVEPHLATGAAVVQSIAAIASGGTQYAGRGMIDVGMLRRIGPPLGIGGLVGSVASVRATGSELLLLYALATTGAAALLFALPEGRLVIRLGSGALVGVSVAIGAVGGALGVGAGFLLIPLLIYFAGVDLRRAAGTGLALPIFLVVPGLIGKAATGQIPLDAALPVAAAALAGAALGARAHPALPPHVVRLGLAVLIAGFAILVWPRALGCA